MGERILKKRRALLYVLSELVVLAVGAFAFAYFVLFPTDSPDKFTLSVGLFTFVSREYGQQWGPFCAGVVLMAVPVVILFLFLQRFIVQGMTGGVKG